MTTPGANQSGGVLLVDTRTEVIELALCSLASREDSFAAYRVAPQVSTLVRETRRQSLRNVRVRADTLTIAPAVPAMRISPGQASGTARTCAAFRDIANGYVTYGRFPVTSGVKA